MWAVGFPEDLGWMTCLSQLSRHSGRYDWLFFTYTLPLVLQRMSHRTCLHLRVQTSAVHHCAHTHPLPRPWVHAVSHKPHSLIIVCKKMMTELPPIWPRGCFLLNGSHSMQWRANKSCQNKSVLQHAKHTPSCAWQAQHLWCICVNVIQWIHYTTLCYVIYKLYKISLCCHSFFFVIRCEWLAAYTSPDCQRQNA